MPDFDVVPTNPTTILNQPTGAGDTKRGHWGIALTVKGSFACLDLRFGRFFFQVARALVVPCGEGAYSAMDEPSSRERLVREWHLLRREVKRATSPGHQSAE
jgi:hypothetical protein